MYAVCNVAYVVFLRVVSVPDVVEHLLAYPSVQLAYSVYLLAGVACEYRHAEAFVVVIRVVASHSDELVPCYAEHLWVSAHVFSEESLIEIVVSGRYRCVYGVE